MNAANSELKKIPIEQIELNPENPRLIFRQGELESLADSIRAYGVQVPISVYRDGTKFVLVDGERRWRCCRKLNLKTIPALIQDKPAPLENLLLMFNIHALREQWDLLTIAMKLPRVIELMTEELGRHPNEAELSRRTGLARSLVRRCKLLVDLPETYKSQILDELEKPKPQQKLTEDLFIEMERSLKTVERALPETIPDKNSVRDVLIEKYRDGTISSVLHFRNIARIARAERLGFDREQSAKVLKRLFHPNSFSIVEAYDASVSELYSERDLFTRVQALSDRLTSVAPSQLDADLRRELRRVETRIHELLGDEQ